MSPCVVKVLYLELFRYNMLKHVVNYMWCGTNELFNI